MSDEITQLRAEMVALKQLQVEIILQLHDELTAQKIENATLRGEIAQLKTFQPITELNGNGHSNNNNRRIRKKAKHGIGAGLAVNDLTEAAEMQTQVVSGSNPGGIIMSGDATYSGEAPKGGVYGLVATSDQNLDLTNLPNTSVGVYASANNFGVYGTSPNGSGVRGTSENGSGVYGVSTNYFGVCAYSEKTAGVYGYSNGGTGIMGASKNNCGIRGNSISHAGILGDSSSGAGIYGISTNGYGVEANSRNGSPLRITPKETIGAPIGGTHEKGEIWLDGAGDVFVYTPMGWKKLKYA